MIRTVEKNLDSSVLMGVGKKMRNAFVTGRASEGEVMAVYRRNLSEADAFDAFGWSVADLMEECRSTHNPVLRDRIQSLLEDRRAKAERSRVQNALSLEKLGFYSEGALGMGIRPVMDSLRRNARNGDGEAAALLLLMQTEFANLHAKRSGARSKAIYHRKDILLRQVSGILRERGWRCGVSAVTGKNASYIVYVYLPDGAQLSWHTNDLMIYSCYGGIDCEWDGQPCSTMEKLLSYAHDRYAIGTPLEKYNSKMAS